jgi:hypothetical protein
VAGLRCCWAALADAQNLISAGRQKIQPIHNALPDKKQNINTALPHKANIYFCFIAGQSPRRKLSSFCRPSSKPPWPAPGTTSTTARKTGKEKCIAGKNTFERIQKKIIKNKSQIIHRPLSFL